jgi:nucleotide-binding universal stress UspA family protein
MFERIVVAYDGSEPARAAARLAFAVAEPSRASVLLAHVVEDAQGLPAHPEVLRDLERLREEQRREWEGELSALAGQAPPGIRIDSAVLSGHAGECLLATLRGEAADLMVVGTHGVGGMKPLLGSVSHQLVEKAACPVLLVREDLPAEQDPLSVIVALDGSADSLRALAAGQALALAFGACLRLVHVVDAVVPFARHPPQGVVELLRRHGEEILREAKDTLSAQPEEVVEELREGVPKEELLAACRENAPALAVIATRGVGGFSGLLVGSTARSLVNGAPCPVLVVRARPPE